MYLAYSVMILLYADFINAYSFYKIYDCRKNIVRL